jgi:hypothetical protein
MPFFVHQLRSELKCFKKRAATVPFATKMSSGRGIVTAGGGKEHVTQLLVQLSLLRAWNCTLPVEIWQLPWEASSFSAAVTQRFKELGATVRNVGEVVPKDSLDMGQIKTLLPSRYSIKAAMLLYSSFEEVLLLDANVLPLRDPTFLFDSETFLEKGSLWWSANAPATNMDHEMAHSIVGIDSDEAVPEIDSGQLLVHKKRSWMPLLLLLFMNFGANANFYQHLSHADADHAHDAVLSSEKDTFLWAWAAADMREDYCAVSVWLAQQQQRQRTADEEEDAEEEGEEQQSGPDPGAKSARFCSIPSRFGRLLGCPGGEIAGMIQFDPMESGGSTRLLRPTFLHLESARFGSILSTHAAFQKERATTLRSSGKDACCHVKVWEGSRSETVRTLIHYALIHYALILINYALILIHYALILIHYALILIHYALILIHYALIHYALILIHYALILIHYALILIHYALILIHSHYRYSRGGAPATTGISC